MKEIEEKKNLLKDMKRMKEDKKNKMNKIKKIYEIKKLSKYNNDILKEISYEISEGNDKGIEKMDNRIYEVKNVIGSGKEEIIKNIKENGVIEEGV